MIEICHVLGIFAADVIRLAEQHVEVGVQAADLIVDLRALVADTRIELRPLHKWARNRLALAPTTHVVPLRKPTMVEMAAIAGLQVVTLIRYLETFTPEPLEVEPRST